jgi:alpha-glucosidase
VGGHDALKLMGQYTAGKRLHSAYSFSMMGPDSSATHVGKVIRTLEETITAPGTACYALSNHDKPRVATRWQNGRDREQTAKEMLALLFSMRGDICMYQGEELGLPQADVPFERLQDPFGITFWPKFKGRDGCRTPMPWSEKKHGGFSESEPWLPVDQTHIELNVGKQEADANSVLHFARRMIALRKQEPALGKGTIELLDAPDGVLAFSRRYKEREVLCVFNMETTPQQYPLSTSCKLLFGQNAKVRNDVALLEVSGFCFLHAADRASH